MNCIGNSFYFNTFTFVETINLFVMEENVSNQKKSNGGYVAVIILLLLALAAMAYFWSAKNKELNTCIIENNALDSDMKGMNEMMSSYLGTMTNDMKTDFTAMLETYDALLEQDQSKADSLMAQKERILELQKEVEKGKMNAYQLFKARKEIESMRRIMRGYIVEIDSLKTLNLNLSNNLETTKTVLSQTEQERDRYKDDAEANAAQVKKGSKLNAYNFKSEGLKMKMNSTMAPTNRARNTEQFKVAFTLSENPIASPGKKMVYLQITDPEGKVLQSSSSNVIDTENGQVAFSDYKAIDYQNQRVDMAIYYKLNGQKASKGNYKVKIFCQGQLVGTDSFTLK